MKKILTLMLLVILTACGPINEVDETYPKEPEKKSEISTSEVLEVLEDLLTPYLATEEVETDEDVAGTMEEIKDKAIEVKRELKKSYEKEIPAVGDILKLTELFEGLHADYTEGNYYLIEAYGLDIGTQIGVIAEDYTDGELPSNYAEVTGVENIYD